MDELTIPREQVEVRWGRSLDAATVLERHATDGELTEGAVRAAIDRVETAPGCVQPHHLQELEKTRLTVGASLAGRAPGRLGFPPIAGAYQLLNSCQADERIFGINFAARAKLSSLPGRPSDIQLLKT